MSYCRVGEDSDVYVIRSVTGELVCYCTPGLSTPAEQAMLDHLFAHVKAGDRVPRRAVRRLVAERDGIPYKTDVERALEGLAFDSLNLDFIGVEGPENLLDRSPDLP